MESEKEGYPILIYNFKYNKCGFHLKYSSWSTLPLPDGGIVTLGHLVGNPS